MDDSIILDHVLLQLNTTKSRCDVVVSCNGEATIVSTGLIRPFASHIKAVDDQFKSGAHLIKLDPRECRDFLDRQRLRNPLAAAAAAEDQAEEDTLLGWFTLKIVERIVTFVKSPGLLEHAVTIEAELQNLDDTIHGGAAASEPFQAEQQLDDSDGRAEEGLRGATPLRDRLSGRRASSRSPSPARSLNGFKTDASSDSSERESRLRQAKDVRAAMLKREQGVAIARAAAAGFSPDVLPLLLCFADCFGAVRLKHACVKFSSLVRRQDYAYAESLTRAQLAQSAAHSGGAASAGAGRGAGASPPVQPPQQQQQAFGLAAGRGGGIWLPDGHVAGNTVTGTPGGYYPFVPLYNGGLQRRGAKGEAGVGGTGVGREAAGRLDLVASAVGMKSDGGALIRSGSGYGNASHISPIIRSQSAYHVRAGSGGRGAGTGGGTGGGAGGAGGTGSIGGPVDILMVTASTPKKGSPWAGADEGRDYLGEVELRGGTTALNDRRLVPGELEMEIMAGWAGAEDEGEEDVMKGEAFRNSLEAGAGTGGRGGGGAAAGRGAGRGGGGVAEARRAAGGRGSGGGGEAAAGGGKAATAPLSCAPSPLPPSLTHLPPICLTLRSPPSSAAAAGSRMFSSSSSLTAPTAASAAKAAAASAAPSASTSAAAASAAMVSRARARAPSPDLYRTGKLGQQNGQQRISVSQNVPGNRLQGAAAAGIRGGLAMRRTGSGGGGSGGGASGEGGSGRDIAGLVRGGRVVRSQSAHVVVRDGAEETKQEQGSNTGRGASASRGRVAAGSAGGKEPVGAAGKAAGKAAGARAGGSGERAGKIVENDYPVLMRNKSPVRGREAGVGSGKGVDGPSQESLLVTSLECWKFSEYGQAAAGAAVGKAERGEVVTKGEVDLDADFSWMQGGSSRHDGGLGVQQQQWQQQQQQEKEQQQQQLMKQQQEKEQQQQLMKHQQEQENEQASSDKCMGQRRSRNWMTDVKSTEHDYVAAMNAANSMKAGAEELVLLPAGNTLGSVTQSGGKGGRKGAEKAETGGEQSQEEYWKGERSRVGKENKLMQHSPLTHSSSASGVPGYASGGAELELDFRSELGLEGPFGILEEVPVETRREATDEQVKLKDTRKKQEKEYIEMLRARDAARKAAAVEDSPVEKKRGSSLMKMFGFGF
ncbi:unnamed protein product [Closterium sp. Naga37s-1]|nr:unnamed protein product [Closterium sp. Naga37s-1]